ATAAATGAADKATAAATGVAERATAAATAAESLIESRPELLVAGAFAAALVAARVLAALGGNR
ncbi:MAG: hypothetical protein M3515_05400, partial [Actinomycetota bacterium]|nr:hypothetical protein [Actinomycetota bacterium]